MESEETGDRTTRNLWVRVLAAIGWLILIYFLSNVLVGGIVGAVAGAGTDGFEAGRVAGEEASIEFFQEYGLLVLIGQITLFSALAFAGKLPGTKKFKRAKDS